MRFCTAINCMDGRVQIPVIEFLMKRFDTDYVDIISEPGPNRLLAEQDNSNLIESILKRVKISVEHHGSVGIAVIGHHDCAGNPAPKQEQEKHTEAAIDFMKKRFGDLPVIGLWVGENWEITEIIKKI